LNDIMQRLLAAFQIESAEHLERIRAILSQIERAEVPDLQANLEEIFRRAHSFKGAARAVDLHPVETLAHRMETLFSRVREGQMVLNPETLVPVSQALDEIEDLIDARLKGQQTSTSLHSLKALDELLGATEQVSTHDTGAEKATSEPQPNALEASPSLGVPVPSAASLRVNADHLDRLFRTSGQFITEIDGQNTMAHQVTALFHQVAEVEREWKHIQKACIPTLKQIDTPTMARLTNFLDLHTQHVKRLSGSVKKLRARQSQNANTLSRLSKQLQADIRQVRMIPAGSVFEGFRKMVRDLAQNEGKEIDFKVQGLDVQADRMVLQALKDPLMHLLRNAVNHGIEPPETRTQAGKSAAGQVLLKIDVLGNRLSIVVSDNGRGIDMQAVVQAAIKQGVLSQAEADVMSPDALAKLIFKPWLTTSQTVTEISGRGMGMSVVYETVMQLQGNVEIQQTKGVGMSIALSVPLSIATHSLLLVSCCGQWFCVPTNGIERLHRVPVDQMQSVEGKQALYLEGKVLPLLSLAHVLNLEETEVHTPGDVLSVIVLISGEKRAAIAVGAFHGVREGFVQDMATPAPKDLNLSGGILLEDGSVAIVLNPTVLIESGIGQQGVVVAMAGKETKVHVPTILVVDDSTTTRTLEKSILEAHGYHVLVAVDGIEALAKLQSETVDLVVTDVQMPRMDGLLLLQKIKNDSAFSKIPVILVTSLDRHEDKERGLMLGADAYLVKQKFDQSDLLDTIKQIL
jgi:two-component system chemotaxis sensor kinase CheA